VVQGQVGYGGGVHGVWRGCGAAGGTEKVKGEHVKPGGQYRKGYAFEIVVRKELEKRGLFVARSAGSHGVDLVAVNQGGMVTLVSCKAYKCVATAEVELMGKLGKKYSCQVMLAIPGRTLKEPELKYVMESEGKFYV
jgi:hypothetical protein